uniref:Nucleoporin p58/p45 n=1 Tax=Strigamia maritima TaxID=126957 RepID=T1IU06_STRMM
MTSSFNFPSNTSTFGSTPSAAFNFGSTMPANSGLISAFGTQQAPTALGFGNPTSTSGGLTLGSAGTLFSTTSFPSTTSQPSLFSGFGATTTTTTKPSFPMGLNTTSTALAPATGFGFPAPSTSTASLNFGFMSTPSTLTSNTSLPSFTGLGTQPVLGAALGAAFPTTSVPANIGLGGINISQTSASDTGIGTSVGKSDKAVKEVTVPSEVLTTVEIVKKYVKDQKNIREEISRISSKPLYNVQKETESLKHLLSVVSNGIQRNAAIVEKLKHETAQELKNAEIAQRTRETPPGLQYENTAPTEYFQNLVAVFENRMQLYRQKIEQMERHLTGLSQCAALTPQELTLAMKRIHETFVALAAQLQIIHEAVKTQKEQYLNYRKVFYGDATNLFVDKESPIITDNVLNSRNKFKVGPTPFSGMSNATAVAMASALNRMQQPSAVPPPTIGFSSGSGLYSSNLGLGTSFNSNLNLSNSNLGFGQSSSSAIKPLGFYDPASVLGSTSWNTTVVSQKQPFQLQKPPQGSKRGKRVAHNN